TSACAETVHGVHDFLPDIVDGCVSHTSLMVLSGFLLSRKPPKDKWDCHRRRKTEQNDTGENVIAGRRREPALDKLINPVAIVQYASEQHEI
ncbi:MAG: hypothetical protein WCK27_21440, partial [Verrucomicrobiota bacterium]